MTVPPNPVTSPVVSPRISVGMKVVDVADSVVVKIIGLIWFTASGYFLYQEFVIARLPTETLHTSHIAIFIGSALFGIALAFTRPVVNTATSLLTVAGPYIPRIGRKDP